MDIVKDDEWGLYPHFTRDEMKCKHTGLCFMTHAMMKALEGIRVTIGIPLIVSSGYRDVSHPAERDKTVPGEHTKGMAVDVLIHSTDAISYVKIATYQENIKRIGISQKGAMSGRFIHIGVGDRDGSYPAGLWSY
jgi:uncharacterized protein YcbK (DUF882 family)